LSAATGGTAGQRHAFPWKAALHHGFCLSRHSSEAFWAMTPREMAAAMGAFAPRAGALPRGMLDAMMGAFPDQ
jgi:uncharacterized phage protein (TIGR02216 family)